MKKYILHILIIISFVVSLNAYSWEGFIDAGVDITGPSDELSLENTDALSLSFIAPLGDNKTTIFSTKGSYEFGYSKSLSESTDAEITHLVDLELLKFSIPLQTTDNSSMGLDIGRFFISDLTGIILSQASDGVKLGYASTSMNLSAYVGFTGLLNAHTVSINAAPNEKILSDAYTFAAPFILVNVSTQFPQLFANQDLVAEIFVALDVGNGDVADNRLYTTAALTGPFVNDKFFYVFSTSLGLVQDTQEEWAATNLTTFELSTFLPFASSLLSWKTVFASASENANFQTFTVNTATLDDSLEYAGHVKTGIVSTFRPIDSLLFLIEPNVLLNVMDEQKDKGYAGFQWLASSRWNATSDLQLVFSAGQFLSAEEGIDPNLKAEVKLSFAF